MSDERVSDELLKNWSALGGEEWRWARLIAIECQQHRQRERELREAAKHLWHSRYCDSRDVYNPDNGCTCGFDKLPAWLRQMIQEAGR